MNHKPTRHPAPGVTSWGVKVKLGAGAREGLTDPGHRSPAVTHTARNPRGPFVPVSLNFPFRDFFFFLNSPLFQSKLRRRTLSPQTRDQKLHTWLQSLVSHTRSATRIVLLPLWCLEHLPASQLWVLLSASATPLRYPMVGRAAPATWLHKLLHLHMRCTVNYFSGTGSPASGPPGTAR